MTAIVAVTNGVTQEDASHFNQYRDTLNAVFGVTDTAQDALGRLVFPRSTSDPGSPSNAQAWFRTDLGVGGRLHLRHGNSQSVPYLPLRQIVLSAFFNDQYSTTSFVDGGMSVSITTTGGRLKIYIAGTNSTNKATISASGGAGILAAGEIRAVVGATNLSPIQFGKYIGNDANEFASPLGAIWVYQPAAGTYTVKIQGRTVGAGGLVNVNGALVVEEWGD